VNSEENGMAKKTGARVDFTDFLAITLAFSGPEFSEVIFSATSKP
jgi:hypothetical protein